MTSGVDWTIIRFIAPTDDPKCGNLKVGFFGEQSFGFKISRADIAALTTAQVDD